MKNILLEAENEYNSLKSSVKQERFLRDPILLCLLKSIEREMEYIFKNAPKTEDEEGYVHIEVPFFEGLVHSNPFLRTVYAPIHDEIMETKTWDCNKDPRINIFSAFQSSSYESMYKTFIPRYNIETGVLKVVYKKR